MRRLTYELITAGLTIECISSVVTNVFPFGITTHVGVDIII